MTARMADQLACAGQSSGILTMHRSAINQSLHSLNQSHGVLHLTSNSVEHASHRNHNQSAQEHGLAPKAHMAETYPHHHGANSTHCFIIKAENLTICSLKLLKCNRY